MVFGKDCTRSDEVAVMIGMVVLPVAALVVNAVVMHRRDEARRREVGADE